MSPKIAYSNDARLTNNVMCLRSRGRAEFRRRRKSLPPPPAEFWSARRHASRIWFAPAGKVPAARLRGLAVSHRILHCKIQANAMQQHFRITLIAMQNNARLSLYHQPICLSRSEAIEGWITVDKNHIVFASPHAGDTRHACTP